MKGREGQYTTSTGTGERLKVRNLAFVFRRRSRGIRRMEILRKRDVND
jgi:hypothetical protein